MKRVVSAVLALGGALLWVVASPLPSLASTCTSTCYSIISGNTATHESGVQMTLNTSSLQANLNHDGSAFFNFMQFTTAAGQTAQFGVCYERNTNQCTPSGLGYQTGWFMYAILPGSNIPGQWSVPAGTLTLRMQGTAHCSAPPVNNWDFTYVINGVTNSLFSTNLGSCWGTVNTLRAGGELIDAYGVNSGDNTTGFSDYVQVFDSSWHYLPSHNAQIDNPCGTSNCFDGYYFPDNHWGWDKRS